MYALRPNIAWKRPNEDYIDGTYTPPKATATLAGRFIFHNNLKATYEIYKKAEPLRCLALRSTYIKTTLH